MGSVTDEFPGVTLSDDVAAADWVRRALRPWGPGRMRVASLVPAGYEAYGRILHRAWNDEEPARWRDIAAQSGVTLDAETRFNELVDRHPDASRRSPPAPWRQPDPGSLRPEECGAVAEVLTEYTTTPGDCWFCVWEGYGTGWPVLNRLGERAPRVALEHRNCLLFRGAVAAATAFRSPPWFQSPTLWWPADRAWCVASELDIFSTYVACATDALHALIAHPALEVVRCSVGQEIDPSPYSRE